MLVQITSFYEICVHYNDDTKRLAGATEETPEYYRYLDEWYRFLIKLINMNENIDLTKILKDCPKGWKFYSSIFGDVIFKGIENDSEYPVKFHFVDIDNLEKYGSVTEQGFFAPYFKVNARSFHHETSVIGLNSLLLGIRKRSLTQRH